MRPYILLNVILLFIFYNIQCKYIPPLKIKDEKNLSIEELTGEFIATKYFFNKNSQLMEYLKSERICTIISDNTIQCTEKYTKQNKTFEKKFCYHFEKDIQDTVFISYDYHCIHPKQKKDKIRGGGFILFTKDVEPFQEKEYQIIYYFARGEKDITYYEEKIYEIFFFSLGKEVTFLQKK